MVRRFDLIRLIYPFTRCMACNEPLRTIAAGDTRGRVPTRIADSRTDFRECPHCRRVYWQGTHYERMREWIEELAAATE